MADDRQPNFSTSSVRLKKDGLLHLHYMSINTSLSVRQILSCNIGSAIKQIIKSVKNGACSRNTTDTKHRESVFI